MPQPRVMTMPPAAFAAACAELRQLCSERSEPDLVIGIIRGGQYVAEQMYPEGPCIMLTRQRCHNELKGNRVSRWLLRHLPYPILNFLRKLEARCRATPSACDIEPVKLSESQAKAISKANRILIVDDAVDTGSTMLAVYEAVAAAASKGATVTTAAITVTTPHPLIEPQFALYRDGTLIRFPWSADYKN